jgi:type I restriction enzyme S subunit
MTPDSWTQQTIAELCEMVKGSAPISKTKPGEFPLVTTGEERKTADYYQFDIAAVCVPMISSTGHGHASLKRVQYQEGKFALSNLLTALIVRDQTVLSPRFLHLYLNYFKDSLIVPLMAGAANMSITVGRLATVPVRFPTLTVQERILRIIDESEELRRLREEADRRITDLTPAIFNEMFGDPAANPKKWRVQPIRELLEVPACYGTMIVPQSTKGKWVDIRVANIRNGELDLSDRKYVNLPDDELKRHEVIDGDILLARAIGSLNHLGKCVVTYPNGEKWAFDSHLMRIRLCKYVMYPEILRALLTSSGGRKLFLNNTRKSAVQFNINTKEFGAIRIPIPPLPLQKQFAARVEEVQALQESQKGSGERLDDLYKSLLYRAFRGEL